MQTDMSNEALGAIKQGLNRSNPAVERCKACVNLFKLVAWFVYRLLSLHPFSDGNGRTCRMLAAYMLGLLCPFPCPLNAMNPHEFLPCLVHIRGPQRQQQQQLEAWARSRFVLEKECGQMVAVEERLQDLVLMLIQSCWFTYRNFIEQLMDAE